MGGRSLWRQVLLVLLTFILTCAGFLWGLQVVFGDVPAAMRMLKVLYVIRTQYVHPVNPDQLLTGAVKGIVDSLEDPHSLYLDPQIYKNFQAATDGEFQGIGIYMGMKNKTLLIISPILGSPGEKAGLRSGDVILQIDGEDASGLSIEEAANKIRGAEGTSVQLTVKREGETKEFNVTRSVIKMESVVSKLLPNQIGYMRILTFNQQTGADFASQYNKLEEQGMKSIILDLRDNPGGLVTECVKVANFFVPQGPIVSMIPRNGQESTSSSTLSKVKYPCVVLINGGSASAAEIVAGAIQDTHAGTLVGTKTYGKGSVQGLWPLQGGGAMKLTIAQYFTPSHRSIDGVGVAPDVKVESQPPVPGEPWKDLQLQKAESILQSQ